MSSFADAMIMASLFNNGSLFESRSRRERDHYQDPFTIWRKMNRSFEVMEETKKKKDEEKKKKDERKPEFKISYLEAVFWLFFLSPIIGPLWYNLEKALVRTLQ